VLLDPDWSFHMRRERSYNTLRPPHARVPDIPQMMAAP
jgi:hypothetical protein